MSLFKQVDNKTVLEILKVIYKTSFYDGVIYNGVSRSSNVDTILANDQGEFIDISLDDLYYLENLGLAVVYFDDKSKTALTFKGIRFLNQFATEFMLEYIDLEEY